MRGRVAAVVVAVNVCALAGTVLVTGHEVVDYAVGASLLAMLAVLGGSGPVRVPSLKTSISTADAFTLTAIAAFGPLPAAVVAAAGVVGSLLGRAPQRSPIRLAFNIGNMVFSTAVGSAIYLLSGGVPGGPAAAQVLPLLGGTLAYTLVNTLLVSVVVAASGDRNFYRTWRESSLWAGLSAFVGMALAAVLIWIIQFVGPTGLALGIPPCWMLATFYRTHQQRQEIQQARIEQLDQINLKLEDMVQERTAELRTALEHIEQANTQLLRTNEQLQQANRTKSEFLANVSHELRTPLNAIIGFSDLLRDPATGALTERQIDYLGDIQESGEHLLGLINSILDLSKIEAGRMEANLERVHLPKAIQDAVAMVRPQAGRKDLALSVACAPDVIIGRLDPGMFRQLLLNLLSNAVKFTPERGSVVVEAIRREADLEVRVRDTGIGIAAEHVTRIFEEFYQVDGSYARNYEGTGLGLALVRRMVEMQGGTVAVASEPGHGSCFTCRFPGSMLDDVRGSDREDAVRVATPARAASDGRTVLLVEDNPMNRKLARNALRSGGFSILEVTSGEEALALLRERRVDLVLMDLQLPGLDGLEVTRRIKADPATAHLTVVAVTAHVQQIDEQQARAAGCAGYITKPIRLARFPEQVAGFLPGKIVSSGR